ncbi:(2Fe-2S) ferredoxin domain-containing protein [Serpentinicella sp. ANB-PHB4]|uniref:(2Fe-2S) ferredoxin domain-containing protein n=1 Tax=Serpentinicella sp. ANB-PHB4 TaxID=3074076 RepID=UPI002866CFD8|nr:(2Fe-2S) ferredoxin domain-containing protein [Serpentinicella sp. ANB-PHB4]MDR5659982.1 (2Fe-2S) ferredoxin domain-containing protein [Serpentinicella sp. ANB-PHB4]
MEIKVCIGSACHLKGAYEVIETFKAYLAKHDLENTIDLKASFCLGECGTAVSVKVENEQVTAVKPEAAKQFIEAVHRRITQ